VLRIAPLLIMLDTGAVGGAVLLKIGLATDTGAAVPQHRRVPVAPSLALTSGRLVPVGLAGNELSVSVAALAFFPHRSNVINAAPPNRYFHIGVILRTI